MKTIKYLVYFLPVILGFLIGSCSDMYDYEKYLEDGEIVYPGKVIDVISHPGYKRIQLSVVLGSDPNISKVKIYWNSRTDSIEAAVQRVNAIDTVDVMIPNLAEGIYNFDLFTFDDSGNMSVGVKASGTVFGDVYVGALLNRALLYAVCGKVVWGGVSDGMIGTEISYTDLDDNIKTSFISNDEMETILSDIKGVELEYRTAHIPDSLAIDTFYTAYEPAIMKNSIFDSGSYTVSLSGVFQSHGWLIDNGSKIQVTVADDKSWFSFRFDDVGVPPNESHEIVVNIDPVTGIPSVTDFLFVNLLEYDPNGGYDMQVSTQESDNNYVDQCSGTIQLYLNIHSSTASDWGGYESILLQL